MSTAGAILDRVQDLLNDDGTRWPRAELLSWLNESMKAIIQLRPDASTVRSEVALVAGVNQVLPVGGLRLIKVTRNAISTGGRAIGLVSREVLDEHNPCWSAARQCPVIQNYMHDPLLPKEYTVYPPAKLGAMVEVVRSFVPADMATEATAYPLDAIYEPVAIDWTVHRAFLRDIESPDAASNAAAYMSMFTGTLTGKTTSDRATRPAAVQPARAQPSET